MGTSTLTAKPTWNPSTWGKRLHTLAHKLGMTDDDYRAALTNGFGVTTSRDLTPKEAAQFAKRLQSALDHAPDIPGAPAPPAEQEHCTPSQIRLMRFHAIPVAIHYCPDNHLGSYANKQTGEILRGQSLRKYLRRQWDRIGAPGGTPGGTTNHDGDADMILPSVIMQRLYTHYINPRCNQMLVEGGKKRWYKDGSRFYPHYQSPEHMQYLIGRWREIHTRLSAAHEQVHQDLLTTTY